MGKFRLFVLLLTGLFAGACSDGNEEVSAPLSAPTGIAISQVRQTSFTVSWPAVEHATAYAYRLLKLSEGDAVTLVKANHESYATQVAFTELTPGTRYLFEVHARAAQGSGYADSKKTKDEITTLPEATTPWVEVVLSYVEKGEKGTLHIVNKPNSKCAHFYSTTANVNVIGEGLDDERTFTDYMISDYETGVPGVYRDSKEHDFNDNGAGFTSGDRLFYGVAGVDAAGKVGDLNWCWVEIPAKAGSPVIILDASEK